LNLLTYTKFQSRKTRLLIVVLLAFSLTFTFIGNDNTAATTYMVTLEADPTSLQIGEDVLLRARVTDEFSMPIQGVPIDFIDDTTAASAGSDSTDGGGWAEVTYTIPQDDPLGVHVFRAEISGAPEYYDTVNVQVIGTISMMLEINPGQQLKGHNVELKATVVDNNNNPLEGATVTFFDATDNFVISSAVTNSQGIAIYDWQIQPNLQTGTHLIQGEATKTNYVSGEDYDSVDIYDPITIELELSESEIERGQTVTVTANVTNSVSSDPEIGANVTFYDDGVPIGWAITDAQGIAVFDYSMPIDASYGDHQLNATVYEGDVRYSEVSEPLTVYMRVNINAIMSAQSVTRDNAISVYVYLTDEMGNPVPDYEVELYDATIDQVVVSGMTDQNGYVELIYGIPVDSPIGPHDLIVRLTNEPQYVRFTEVQETLDVYASTDLHIDLQVTDADRGDIVDITATLTDDMGNQLEGYTILFYANSTYLGSVVTNVDGVAVFAWTVGDSILGQYDIRAEFIASGYYHSSTSNSEPLAIYSNPSLDVTVQDHARIGESVVIQVLLTDENGASMEGYVIEFYLNGELQGTEITDVNGIATYTWIPSSTGLFTVHAEFDGIGFYRTATSQVEQIEVQTFYMDAPETADRGDVVTLFATLTDVTGVGIEGEEVFFYLNGMLLGNAMTDSSGIAQFDWLIANDLIGVQTLHAECPSLNYVSTDVFTTVYSNTSLSIQLSDSIVDHGDAVTITVTLTDENGALEGYEVVIYLNGELLTIVTTNSQGMGEFIWTADEVGSHLFHGNFTGSGYYGPSVSSTSNVEVYTTPSLTLNSPTTGERGDIITLVAELTDAGIPMEGYTIDFLIDGQFLGSAITNSSGYATYTWTVDNTLLGDVSVQVEFAGFGFYNPDSDTNTITIYSNPSLTLEVVDDQDNPVTEVTQGNTVIFRATLLDEAGNPISGQSILFYLNGSIVGTTVSNTQGIAELPFTFTYKPSEVQTVYADFGGMLYYLPCVSETTQLTVFVDNMNIITTISDSYIQNEAFDLFVDIKDAENPLFGVGDVIVQVYLNDVLIGEGVTQTGIQAGEVTISCVIPSDAQVGVGTIKIIATKDDGSGVIRLSTLEQPTTILSGQDDPTPEGTSIEILSDTTVEMDKDHTVKVKVTEDGEPMDDIKVKLYAEVDGKWELQDEDTTNDDGEVKLKMKVQDELGSQRIKIVTESKTKTATLKVKYKPDIDLDLDTGIELGDTLDIKLTIKDHDGEPIQVKVSIYFDGELLISEKTDEDGSIETNITPDEIGEYEVKIKIDSIPDAIVETIKKTVRVGEPIDIEYDENPIINGANSTISVTLRHANGTGVAEVSIDVYIEGQGEGNVTSSGLHALTKGDYHTTIVTDENGVASFSMKSFEDGDYIVRLVFYRGDIKENVTIKMNVTVHHGGISITLPVAIPGMQLIGLVMAICASGVIAFCLYYFFIRKPEDFDPMIDLQSSYTGELPQNIAVDELGFNSSIVDAWSEVDPIEYGIKAIYLIEFDPVKGPVLAENRIFDVDTDFNEVIMNPTNFISFYMMGVNRGQFKMEEPNEYIFGRTVTTETPSDGTMSVQGDTISSNLLVVVTKKTYDETFVQQLIEMLMVDWSDQQGYLVHLLDQFISPNMIEVHPIALA